MKSKINYLFFYTSQLLVSLIVFLIIILFVSSQTVLNPNYIIKELDKHDYYEYLEKSIRNEMDNYVVQSGLSSSVLDGIYDKKLIVDTANNYVRSFYNNKSLEVDSSKVKDNLELNIDKYLKEKNVEASDMESLDKFVIQMTDIFEESFSISNIVDKISPRIVKLIKYINILLYVSLFCLVMLVIILKIIFKKNILSIPLFTSSLLSLFMIYYISFKIDFNNLIIFSNSKIINNVSLDIISYFRNISFLLIFIGIAIYIINDRISSRSLGDKNEVIK